MTPGESKEMDTAVPLRSSKKLTPGPYKATKLWNGIVQDFRDEMQCKKHRRHLKLHNSCFTASEAVEFLQQLLRSNPNIGKEVTKQQTVQLLRKFLLSHVIEDVQGRWGSENLEDDGRLYRFPLEYTTSEVLRQPLAAINGDAAKNLQKKKAEKKQKRKSKGPIEIENSNFLNEEKKLHPETETVPSIRRSSCTSTSSEHLKRPLPPAPTIRKCRVIAQKLTESDIRDVWKKELLTKLQNTLQLDTWDEVIVESEIRGEDIRHNATRVGKSGVVQVDKDDIPFWALNAMTCLANWPNNTDRVLPTYAGFENDVFRAVCEYYCGLDPPMSHENDNATRRPAAGKRPGAALQPEPLLTYDHYELFTNIMCLIQPGSESVAIEALRHALLILPPLNRRKLHLLVRLMSRICSNPHLAKLGGEISTRMFLLQTFSRYILSYNEEVYLDELLAMRLVSFLIDHHLEVMEVPTDIATAVERKLAQMRKPEIRYSEACEEIADLRSVQAANQSTRTRMRNKVRTMHADRHKRKSADIMRSWDKLVTSIKRRPISQAASSRQEKSEPFDREAFEKVRLRPLKAPEEPLENEEPVRRCRARTRTVGSPQYFNLSEESTHGKRFLTDLSSGDPNESYLKSAKSCSDIRDNKATAKVGGKSSDTGSSWNAKLFRRRPFSKARKSKA